jgi:hypothetical protein
MAHIPIDELLRIAELVFNQYSIIARKGTADTTEPLDFPANSIVARVASGDLSDLSFGQDTLLGRFGSGSLEDLSAGDARSLLDVSFRAPQVLAVAAVLDYDLDDGVNAVVTLNQAGHTLAFDNPADGMTGIIQVIQGAGGETITSYTVSGGSVKFAGGTPPTLSSGAGDIDLLEWYYDGTDIHLKTYILDSQ